MGFLDANEICASENDCGSGDIYVYIICTIIIVVIILLLFRILLKKIRNTKTEILAVHYRK